MIILGSRSWLLIPLLALQSGCAMLTSYNQMEPQIDKWIEAKQYGRALDTLSSVDPTDPKYPEAAEKRKEVEALAARYEQEVRRQTRADLDKERWAEALDSFDEALERLPKSAVIKDGLAQLHQEQDEELERLELERLIAHGEWLKTTLPTYQQIARVDPRNRTASLRLEKKRNEAEEVASELALYGNKALANDNLEIADRTLSLAAALSNAPAIGESLKKLRQQQEQARAKARAQRQKRRQRLEAAEQSKARLVNEQLKQYRAAFVQKDFISARKHLKALQQADPGNPKWEELTTVLHQATEEEVERLFESGVTAYSRGHFEQAATLWRKALELNPEHKQAKESLDRAERVLDKLKELKGKQEGGE